MTTRAPAAIRRPTASATRSRSRSASRTTASSGPARTGPRNQRRTPMAINTAFYPTLMWNSRFHAPSGDPFDNRQGFVFPAPEGTDALLPAAPAHGAGVHSADRARRSRRVPLPRQQRRHPRRSGAAPERQRATTGSCSRASFPHVKAGGADHVRRLSPARSPSSSSRRYTRTRRSIVMRAASRTR